jgi:hypothetical protein
VLSLFAREALERSDPINSLLIERVILDELHSTDSATTVALRRAVQQRFGERVSAAAVVAVADRLVRADARPPVQSRAIASAPQAATSTTTTPPLRPASTAGERRVTMADLIGAGLLPDGAPIEASVDGVSHAARIKGGRIELNGASYDSPSAASIALRNVRSWNGWVDWRYQGETLAEIRKRLPDGEVEATKPAAG